ncbi:MAG: electron transfer flavoprotein subunit beta, partial [Candidatus Bipolaricaulia bacterium]
LLAHRRGLPYVGAVRRVEVDEGRGVVVVQKEYPGGLAAEIEVALPAVLGIQAAESPPRYVPFGRVRQAMRTAEIEERPVEGESVPLGFEVRRLFKPEVAGRAELLEGSPEEVARRLKELLKEKGLVR